MSRSIMLHASFRCSLLRTSGESLLRSAASSAAVSGVRPSIKAARARAPMCGRLNACRRIMIHLDSAQGSGLRRPLLFFRLEAIEHVIHIRTEKQPAVGRSRAGANARGEAEALPDNLTRIHVAGIQTTAAGRIGQSAAGQQDRGAGVVGAAALNFAVVADQRLARRQLADPTVAAVAADHEVVFTER